MNIIVKRKPSDGTATMGEMLIDSVHECWTLEPPNPIAALTYDLVIDFSNRFQRLMPHVLNVPQDNGVVGPDRGIRIHWGNVRKDTEKCLLVGQTQAKDFVGHSVDEFNVFFRKLQSALEEGPVTITYLDPIPSTTVVSGAGGGD